MEYYTAATTRLLSFFAHWRFLYFHGQRHARLVGHQTVYNKPKHERSLRFTLLSPLLFLAPDDYLRDAEILQTDDIIIRAVWKSFMTRLLGEWEDMILWSTVMLTANSDEREPSEDFHISCPDRQLPLDRSQRGKHCDWLAPGSPQPYQTGGRPSRRVYVFIPEYSQTLWS